MSAKPQPMPGGDDQPIIIIKKIKKVSGGHHGGSWKVAYADFVTAMMALFLLLWLVGSSSEEQKKAIAGYFRHDQIQVAGGGSSGMGLLDGGKGLLAAEAAQDSVRLLSTQAAVSRLLDTDGALAGLSDQVKLSMTEDGLQIEIIDKANSVLFDGGSAALKPAAVRILAEITHALGGADNRLVIGGHTDSRPYAGRFGRSNWELSTERANSARAAMVDAGLTEAQLATVAGYADTRPRPNSDPADPSNRRISIVLLRKSADPGAPRSTPTGALLHPESAPAPAPERPPGVPDAHHPPGSLSLEAQPGDTSRRPAKSSAVREKDERPDPRGQTVKPEEAQAPGNHHP